MTAPYQLMALFAWELLQEVRDQNQETADNDDSGKEKVAAIWIS